MEQYELLLYIVQCLERLEIPYLITGSIASMAYGEPRFTNDIDIVADIDLSQAQGLKDCFSEPDFYLEIESIRTAIRRHLQFNIIHPSSGLKIDIMIPDRDAFNRSRFARKKRLHISKNDSAEFAAPEDIIIKKLEYYQKGGSDKHLRDIAGMMKISGSMIDDAYLGEWADRLGLSKLWKSVLAKLSD